jgi:hypothetical protein
MSGQKIKILTNRTQSVNALLEIGKPLDFHARVGGKAATVCLDTGGGANVINKTLLDDKSFKVLQSVDLETPIGLEVGNSQEIELTQAILAELKVGDKTATLWWLVNPLLPLPALIGRPSAKRLGLTHNTQTDRVSWEGHILDNANVVIGCHRTKPMAKIPPAPPQETTLVTTTRIPPRTMVKATVKLQENKGPEGYFMPNFTSKGKLLLIPGLVDFTQGDEPTATILVLNPTCARVKIKANSVLGQTQVLSDNDVRRTELIELSNIPLTQLREVKKSRSEQAKVADDQQKKPQTRTLNVKVSMSYSNPDNEKGSASPFMFTDLLASKPTPEFLEGYLYGTKGEPNSPDIAQVINLLSKGEGESSRDELPNMEGIPDELHQAYKLFQLHKCDLSTQQRVSLAKLLNRHLAIWNEERSKGPLQRTEHTECPIEIKEGAKPLRSRARRTTPAEDYIIWKHLDKMLKRDVIRPSKSPWASPILLADKKNGKVRFCVDYRRLNELTVKDAYPLPRMDEILATLGSASHYSTMDLTDAFWSIPIREQDVEKTAFISKYGLWEFISMPFGLTNAPATQQRFIEAVLNGLVWDICFAYIDDILCFSDSFEKHLEDLDKIMTRLEQHNLVIQPAKCTFCRPTFEILGFVATRDGLKPNPKKVEAILNYPYPASRKETECFMGMVSWLRKFIPRASAATKSIRECMKQQGTTFVFTKEAMAEVDNLKAIMASDICIAHPDTDKQFYIHVDASKKGLGAILTQVDKYGNHRVIEYASKSLTNAQMKYSNSVREGYGILWSLNYFRFYVQGRDPIVFCDCKCLAELFRPNATKIPEHVSLRDWVARILHYNPRILHKPGKLMSIPDALSRHYAVYSNDDADSEDRLLGSLITAALQNRDNPIQSLQEQEDLLKKITPRESFDGDVPPIRSLLLKKRKRTGTPRKGKRRKLDNGAQADTSERQCSPGQQPTSGRTTPPLSFPEKKPREEKTSQNDNISEQPTMDLSKLAMEQRTDPALSELIDFIQMGRLPKNRHQARHIRSTVHQYMVDDQGVLRKIDERTKTTMGPRAVLPRALWDQTIRAYHDHPLSGHRKFRKLLAAVSDVYYFPGMSPYIWAYSQACVLCRRTVIGKKPTSPILPYHASYPGITVHLDCTPGSARTPRGNTDILAIVDSFTGYIKLYAVPKPDAKTMAEALLGYIAVNSMPLKIITDNGTEFANELMTELSLLLGLKQTFIAPYNSRSNGKVENSHKTTQTMLRAYIEQFPYDWDLLIPLVEFAMNTSKSDVTGYTPFYLHFGRHPIMPLDMLYEATSRPEITVNDYVKKLETEREKVIAWVNERRDQAAKKSIKRDKNRSPLTLNLGDHVLRLNAQRKGEHGQKYNPIYHRKIYVVSASLDNGAYMIQDIRRLKPPRVANVAQLKRLGMQTDLHMHDGTISTIPRAIYEENANEGTEMSYEINKILNSRVKNGTTEYKVWFKGYRKSSAQWCPEKDLNAPDAVADYLRDTKNKG